MKPRVWRAAVAAVFLFAFNAQTGWAADAGDRRIAEARIKIDAGEMDAANKMLLAYLDAGGPKTEYADYLITLTSFASVNPADVQTAVDGFLDRHPFSPYASVMMLQAAQYFQTRGNDPQKSASMYSKFFMYYPEDPQAGAARIGHVAALIDAGKFDRAITVIRQARAIHDYTPQEISALDEFWAFARQEAARDDKNGLFKRSESKADSKSGAPDGGWDLVKRTREALFLSDTVPGIRSLLTSSRSSVKSETARDAKKKNAPPASAPSANVPAPAPSPAEPSRRPEMAAPYALMNFHNASIDDVLKHLSAELGLTFMKDPDVQAKITLVPKPRLMTKPQALALLESVLQAKGYLMKGTDDVYTIRPASKPDPSRTAAATVVSSSSGSSDVEFYPTEEGAVARQKPAIRREVKDRARSLSEDWVKIYALRFANADRLSTFIRAMLEKDMDSGPLSDLPIRMGIVSADRLSNSIIVVGSPDFQEILTSLIQKLDYNGFSEFHVRVIPLRFANATEVAVKFENIVSWESQTRGDSAAAHILIQADPRLNALLLSSASQSQLQTFVDLVTELDKPFFSPQIKAVPSLMQIRPMTDELAP